MTMRRDVCVVIGGGGHAKVIIDALHASGVVELAGILDADSSRWGTEVLGVPVLGGDALLADLALRDITSFIVGVGSVGDSSARRRVFASGCAAGLRPLTAIHPSAICARTVQIGGGSILLAGSIVNAGATVGINVIVNSGAIIEHDCVVGDHAHVATGARMASAVAVGAGAHIGIGASIRQGVTIGANAVVAAGAVVIADVPPGAVVMGVPARVRGYGQAEGERRPEKL